MVLSGVLHTLTLQILLWIWLGLATKFCSKKILRNRLGTVSVIPRKKVLIPRHSEVYVRVSSEARNGKELNEKKSFTAKSSSSEQNWERVFVRELLRNRILRVCFFFCFTDRNSELFLFCGMVRNEIPSVCFNFVPRYGIPSCFFFRGMVQNRIPRVCFYLCSFFPCFYDFFTILRILEYETSKIRWTTNIETRFLVAKVLYPKLISNECSPYVSL